METIFLKEPDLVISNRRIEVEKRLFPLYALTSVERKRTKRRDFFASTPFFWFVTAALAQAAGVWLQIQDLLSPWPALGAGFSDLRVITLLFQAALAIASGFYLRAKLRRKYFIHIAPRNPADRFCLLETDDPRRAAQVSEALRNAVIHYREPSSGAATPARGALAPLLAEPTDEDEDDDDDAG